MRLFAAEGATTNRETNTCIKVTTCDGTKYTARHTANAANCNTLLPKYTCFINYDANRRTLFSDLKTYINDGAGLKAINTVLKGNVGTKFTDLETVKTGNNQMISNLNQISN